MTIEVSRLAVLTNMFPLWEKDSEGWTLNYKNDKPIPVTEFIEGIGKFSRMSEQQIEDVQRAANERYATVKALAGMQL